MRSYEKRRSDLAVAEEQKRCDLSERELRQQIDLLKTQLDQESRCNSEIESFLRSSLTVSSVHLQIFLMRTTQNGFFFLLHVPE